MGTLKTVVAILLTTTPVIFVAEATAQQTEAPRAGQNLHSKIIHGQVRSIDPAGTALTLTDGTTLVAPPGATIRPGAVTEGMTVIASYREENGEKVMTELAVAEPSASPPSDPRFPAQPSPVPRESPKRY